MGNFSRNTFDPLKDYVGVRLQQGVPVLDADWNELNDVTRQELYDTFSLTFTDGVQPEALILKSAFVRSGMISVSGRSGAGFRDGCLRKNLRYSTSHGPTRSGRRATAWR